MTFYRGPGAEIGQGLAALATQFIGTQNTLQQQDQQRAQQDTDNAFRQQQAEEQRRQFEAQAKQGRDTQAYQFLSGQGSRMTEVLAKGGYAKGSPEFQAAQAALSETNKLMGKTLRGVELTPEELAAYDTLIGNVGSITATGAGNIGGRAAAGEELALTGAGLQNEGRAIANEGGQQQNTEFGATTGYRTNVARVQSEYAEPNAAAGLANVEAGTAATQTNTALTALQVQQVTKTADSTIALINSNNDLGQQKNAVMVDLLKLDRGAQQAEYLGKIASQGEAGQAILTQLVKDGAIDQPTADAAMAKAQRVVKVETAQTAALEIGVDTAQFQLQDMKEKAPLVYDGMKLSNQTAKQMLDFNGEANPERLAAFKLQNDQTRQAISQSDQLFPEQKALLTAQVDLTQIQAEVAEGTKDGTIDGSNAQNWNVIALSGNPATFDRLVKEGKMTAQQAAPWKRLAEAAQRKRDAEVTTAEATATTAGSQARVQVATEGAQTDIVNTQAATGAFNLQSAKALFPIQLKSAQTALDTANEQLSAFREQRPFNLDLLRTNIATLKQELSQNAQLFGPKLAQAQATVGQLESQLRVMEGSEAATISTAASGATSAAAQATSATVAAQVDVATIPQQIAARTLTVENARAGLAAQLSANRFTDTTFGARVKALDLNNDAGVQQLLTLKQQYSQNAQKFPEELAYLNAQTSVMKAQAEKAASELVGSTGGVTDRKTMVASLDAMRKINADERRIAANNLRNVTQRLLPNAKFSIDKYDPKAFTQLVASQGGLSPDQRVELQNAQLAFDNASSKSSDLSTAFAQVSGKGRMDPKLAERLGFFAPGEGETDAENPYGSKDVGGVQLITKFTGTAPIPKSFDINARYAISKTAGRLGIDANALAAVISFETAGSFDPAKRNPNSSATGLIQFMDSTAKGMGTTTAALAKMPFGKQMEYVERYLKERGIGPGSSMGDVYQAVTGSGYKKGTAAYEQNKVWDANGDGTIDRNEQTLNPTFAGHVRDYFGGQGTAGPKLPAGTAPEATAAPAAQPTPAAPAPTAPPGRTSVSTPAVNGLPPLAGANLDKAAAGQLTAAYRTIAKLPAVGQQTEAQRKLSNDAMSTVAAQLSTRYGVTITPADVWKYIAENRGNL